MFPHYDYDSSISLQLYEILGLIINKNTILMRMVFMMVETRGVETLSEDHATRFLRV